MEPNKGYAVGGLRRAQPEKHTLSAGTIDLVRAVLNRDADTLVARLDELSATHDTAKLTIGELASIVAGSFEMWDGEGEMTGIQMFDKLVEDLKA
jgi:hypothetical protein